MRMSDSELREPPRVLFTGAGGQLGTYLGAELARRGIEAVGTVSANPTGQQWAMDITRLDEVRRVIAEARPTVVIHGAAYTDVDGCEKDPERADLVNHIGARNVATVAKEHGAWVVAVGTDFVFSGRSGYPYTEDAATDPISIYGASKLAGEMAVLEADDAFAVARTSWVFGGAGKHFPRTVLTMVRDRGGMAVVNDEASCPTFAGDLAVGLVDLIPHRPPGILHLMNEGSVEFLAKYPLPAKRPGNSTMVNTRAKALGVALPAWQDAVARYIPRAVRDMQFPPS
jgi:dTDP-4-dehydrorhamnose reductase